MLQVHKRIWGDVTSELASGVITADHGAALSEGSDSADSAPVPCGSPRSCCHSPWLPSIPDDSNKISSRRGPRTRHYGPLRSCVFTQSDNYRKAPLNHIIRRWPGEIGEIWVHFRHLEWMTGDVGGPAPCSRSAAAASSRPPPIVAILPRPDSEDDGWIRASALHTSGSI